jgi:hypothetical protein
MANTFYTAGYTGHTPAQLKEAAETLGAIVFDARFSAWSRNPDWTRPNLERVFDRSTYRYVPEFGNKNYKGEFGNGIMLSNYEGGKAILRNAGKPVILLCMCRELVGCHRNTVREQLERDGFTYKGEIPWPKSGGSKPAEPKSSPVLPFTLSLF